MKSWLLLLFVGVVMACGPSSGQIKTAKTARYSGPPQTLFDVAVQETQKNYTIGEVDAENSRLATAPQMYSAEGGRQSPGAGGFVSMSDGSVQLALIVEVVPAEGGRYAVVITPQTFQVVTGSPKPRELEPDDPNLPPWVHGRVDALAVAIFEAARQYAVVQQ